MVPRKVMATRFYLNGHTIGFRQQTLNLEMHYKNTHKLQLMQNFAACTLTNTGKFHHISPVLHELGARHRRATTLT